MSDARKPKLKEAVEDPAPPRVDLRSEPQSAPDKPLGPEQLYLKRKAEVTQQDNEAFAEYLQEKRACGRKSVLVMQIEDRECGQ